MLYDLWINLPVKDLARTRAFFDRIGMGGGFMHQSDTMLGMKVGRKDIAVMFVLEEQFQKFSLNRVPSGDSTGVLISLGVESREEVDELARQVTAAGGNVFSQPAEIDGWMYGCAFADPDGNCWNALYMDMERMPKK